MTFTNDEQIGSATILLSSWDTAQTQTIGHISTINTLVDAYFQDHPTYDVLVAAVRAAYIDTGNAFANLLLASNSLLYTIPDEDIEHGDVLGTSHDLAQLGGLLHSGFHGFYSMILGYYVAPHKETLVAQMRTHWDLINAGKAKFDQVTADMALIKGFLTPPPDEGIPPGEGG